MNLSGTNTFIVGGRTLFLLRLYVVVGVLVFKRGDLPAERLARVVTIIQLLPKPIDLE